MPYFSLLFFRTEVTSIQIYTNYCFMQVKSLSICFYVVGYEENYWVCFWVSKTGFLTKRRKEKFKRSWCGGWNIFFRLFSCSEAERFVRFPNYWRRSCCIKAHLCAHAGSSVTAAQRGFALAAAVEVRRRGGTTSRQLPAKRVRQIGSLLRS